MGDVKQYTLDTNIFRYETNPSADHLQKAARVFWNQIRQEMLDGEAVLLVPKEVVRELHIQSFTLSEKENNKIAGLLKLCTEVVPERLSPEIEHQIREMSAYVRSEFKADIGMKMEYGGVSDARILYSAYSEDSILVTANVKDFLLYPLLFKNDEERLYDMKENAFVKIPEDVYSTIHADSVFKGLLQDFFELDED
ncbi:hypothetical protein AKG34_26280 [Peribacillus butanolivorans]|uniref:DUF4411 family protein n=1 Tax=Peribacillus butanolivorans TaxID=421767 RepID=UPI0006A73DF6|nr:DUF4411 family protein [Peribacillus butanolivorans]KON66455.1 hypothetical protein AKG34_26280 [Peribacillus butanolivorans]